MFKNHSLTNDKESVIGITLATAMAILVLLNLILLVPIVIKAYAPDELTKNLQPIDTETVNQALQILGGNGSH